MYIHLPAVHHAIELVEDVDGRHAVLRSSTVQVDNDVFFIF